MKTNYSKYLIPAAAALILGFTSCGTWKEKAKDAVDNTNKAPELQNDWRGNCKDAGFLPLSAAVALKFGLTDFERKLKLSGDGDCNTVDVTIKYTGTYTVGEQNETQKSLSVRPIDLRYDKVIVVALTDKGKDVLNTANFCGVNDWKIYEEYNLSDKSRLTGCTLIDLPETQYDVFSTSGDQLRFGQTGITSATNNPSQRPTNIEGPGLSKE